MSVVAIELPGDEAAGEALLYRALKALILQNRAAAQERFCSCGNRMALAEEARAAAAVAKALYPGDDATRREIDALLVGWVGDGTPLVDLDGIGVTPKPKAPSIRRHRPGSWPRSADGTS
jgi:hypothetical protein